MDKEKLVVDLETARILKEAGWQKVTVFKYYVENIYHNTWTLGLNVVDSHSVAKIKIHKMLEDLPAPTFEEIWEELPKEPIENENFFLFEQDGIHLGWGDDKTKIKSFTHLWSLSSAAAKAWLWCKENKHL